MAYFRPKNYLFIPVFGILFSAIKHFRTSRMEISENIFKISLRHDQKLIDIGLDKYQKDAHVYSFAWTKKLLDKLNEKIPDNSTILIQDASNQTTKIDLKKPLVAKDLIMLARNEAYNVNGRIKFDQYPEKMNKSTILSIKDLVRHEIIVGKGRTVSYGGYPGGRIVKQDVDVILVDLIGLQFQQDYNSGRLVLIGEDLPKGDFDDLLFQNVVGEEKPSYEQVKSDNTNRFVEIDKIYFDTKAYQMFVANDFMLVCLAVNHFTKEPVNLKFLKYGTGFFGGKYRSVLFENIDQGIMIGLERYLNSKINKNIKSFEFPFYEENFEIKKICELNNVGCKFSKDDALKSSGLGMLDATTNCADPHVVAGNEMGYSSVDAAIASNLELKANQFSPVINKIMRSFIVDEDGTIHDEIENSDHLNKSNL